MKITFHADRISYCMIAVYSSTSMGCIGQQIFHAQIAVIMIGLQLKQKPMKKYRRYYPLQTEKGADNIKHEIERNCKQIKLDFLNIAERKN
jgi:hypothetical protein